MHSNTLGRYVTTTLVDFEVAATFCNHVWCDVHDKNMNGLFISYYVRVMIKKPSDQLKDPNVVQQIYI